MQMIYTYELEFTPRKFMDFPSIEETYYFWKEQNKKGINVKFFDHPLYLNLDVTGDSLEDCNIKVEKFKK